MITGIKNRKTVNIIFFVSFVISLIMFLCLEDCRISLFKIDIYFNKVSAILMLLSNLVLFLYNLISRNAIKTTQKLFYPLSVISLFLLNAAILVDNLLLALVFIFMLFAINNFLEKSKQYFFFDCTVLFISFVLLSFGLLRYFILSDISFSFLNITQYPYKPNDITIHTAFFGILILIFRLFNLIPFNRNFNNSFVLGFYTIIYYTIGSVLLEKIFIAFNYSMFKMQSVIVYYLIFNLIYYAFIQFRAKSIIEFLKYTLPVNLIIGFFGLFLFNENGFSSYIYYAISTIISYGAGFILSDLIEKKIGCSNFSALKKISHKDKLIKIFVFTIFLNLAKMPPFIGFCAFVCTMLNIFLIEWDSTFMVFVPYIIFASMFLVSINSFNVIYKILIKPLKTLKKFVMLPSQIFVLTILCIIIFISAVGVQYIINQFVDVINTGSL